MMVMKTGVGALTDDEARFVEIYGRFAWPIQAYCARRTPVRRWRTPSPTSS